MPTHAAGVRIQAHLRVIVGAVIGALALGDFRPTGEGTRRLQRCHHRLRAGVGEPHLIDRRQPRHEQLGKVDLGFRRQAKGRSERELAHGCLDQRGMSMAVDQGREIVDAVDQLVSVNVPDAAAFTARGIDRIGFHEHGRARVAARQAGKRADHRVLWNAI